jgi:hypothetical protein
MKKALWICGDFAGSGLQAFHFCTERVEHCETCSLSVCLLLTNQQITNNQMISTSVPADSRIADPAMYRANGV